MQTIEPEKAQKFELGQKAAIIKSIFDNTKT